MDGETGNGMKVSNDEKKDPICVMPCHRFKYGPERMTVATRDIKAGETFLTMPWFGRATFLGTSKEECREKGVDKEPITFTKDEVEVLKGGCLVDGRFLAFGSPGHIQLMLDLIEKQSDLCAKWVKDQLFKTRPKGAIGSMAELTNYWIEKSLRYLKDVRHVSNDRLMFWLKPGHMNQLYNIIYSNAFFLDFILSGSIVGVVFCPVLACFNHDCVPNAFTEKLPNGYRVTAAMSIKKGEEICIPYINEAVGLLTDDEINVALRHKHGFECECPTHLKKRPLYIKGVVPPSSLEVLCYKNASLAKDLEALNHAHRLQDFACVRQMCYLMEKKWGDLIKKEPRLAYFVSNKYISCVSNVTPDGEADRWLQLYQDTLMRFCVNPVYILRSFFWSIMETVRRFNVVEFDRQTGSYEHVFASSHTRYVSIFLMSWLNLKRRLKFLFNSENALELEGCMFNGLTKYMTMMKAAFKEMEDFVDAEDKEAAERQKNEKSANNKSSNNESANKSKKKKSSAGSTKNKKEKIVATTYVVDRERVVVNSPYPVTDIDEKAMNLYYFNDKEGPVQAKSSPAPLEKDAEYLNGFLQESEVDELIKKNNPSFFPREPKDAKAPKEPKSNQGQSIEAESEPQKALNKEFMKPAKNVSTLVVKSKNKKSKRKTALLKQATQKVTSNNSFKKEEDEDDEDIFIPIQIDYDEVDDLDYQ
jgi:hypothetical protein